MRKFWIRHLYTLDITYMYIPTKSRLKLLRSCELRTDKVPILTLVNFEIWRQTWEMCNQKDWILELTETLSGGNRYLRERQRGAKSVWRRLFFVVLKTTTSKEYNPRSKVKLKRLGFSNPFINIRPKVTMKQSLTGPEINKTSEIKTLNPLASEEDNQRFWERERKDKEHFGRRKRNWKRIQRKGEASTRKIWMHRWEIRCRKKIHTRLKEKFQAEPRHKTTSQRRGCRQGWLRDVYFYDQFKLQRHAKIYSEEQMKNKIFMLWCTSATSDVLL